MVESAIADVVRPTVTADDPDAPSYQMIDDRKKVARRFRAIGEFEQPGLNFGHTDSLSADIRFPHLWSGQNCCRKSLANSVERDLTKVLAISWCLSAARRKPSPNSALSSNSEFDHAGPRPS